MNNNICPRHLKCFSSPLCRKWSLHMSSSPLRSLGPLSKQCFFLRCPTHISSCPKKLALQILLLSIHGPKLDQILFIQFLFTSSEYKHGGYLVKKFKMELKGCSHEYPTFNFLLQSRVQQMEVGSLCPSPLFESRIERPFFLSTNPIA